MALEDLYGRRLARAVSAEKAQDLTGRDFKGDAVDPFNLAVGLAQIVHFDDGSHPSDHRQQRQIERTYLDDLAIAGRLAG